MALRLTPILCTTCWSQLTGFATRAKRQDNVPSFLNVYLKVFKQNTRLQYKLRSTVLRTKNSVASINVRLQTELRYHRYRYNYTVTLLRKNPKT